MCHQGNDQFPVGQDQGTLTFQQGKDQFPMGKYWVMDHVPEGKETSAIPHFEIN